MSGQKNHKHSRAKSQGRIAARATAQGGVVSLDQLRDEGVSRRQAAERAEGSSLHRVIDVTVPVEAGRKIDGIRCRRCRYPEPEEIEARRGVAVTTPARTLVDLAGIVDLGALRKTVGRAATRKRLDVQAVDVAIYNAKDRRGLKRLELALAPYRTKDGKAPDVRSDFETLVLPDLLELGLVRPQVNAWLHVEGERFLVDFLWEQAMVIVETDGRETHETPAAFQGDRRRDQFLAAAGYRVLRVTWDQIHGERAAVLERIGRAVSPRRRR